MLTTRIASHTGLSLLFMKIQRKILGLQLWPGGYGLLIFDIKEYVSSLVCTKINKLAITSHSNTDLKYLLLSLYANSSK